MPLQAAEERRIEGGWELVLCVYVGGAYLPVEVDCRLTRPVVLVVFSVVAHVLRGRSAVYSTCCRMLLLLCAVVVW